MKYQEKILKIFLDKLRFKDYKIYSIYPSKENENLVYHIKLVNGLKMTLIPGDELTPRNSEKLFNVTFHHLRFNSDEVDLINKVCWDLGDAFVYKSTSFSVDQRDFIYMETNKDW